MPAIQITNNTSLNFSATSADSNATLNRYLLKPLTFVTPAGLASIADMSVGSLNSDDFPLTASASASGTFAVEQTALTVQPAATASLGLLTGDDKNDFLDALQMPHDPAGLLSFGLTGTLSVSDTAATGDFTFGIANNASVGITSFYGAAAADTFASAIQKAVASLTIPHDVDDLKSLPPNAICQLDAASCLQFAASVTYNVLNNPLATKSITNLPTITVNATAGATLEATVTHKSDHRVTIGKLANGKIHLAVSLRNTDDFETSLTVSAGITADVGSTDALAFLLNKISPNSTVELEKLRADMSDDAAQQYGDDIKGAIDAALSSSLQAALKTSLDECKSNNRIFLYEIDLSNLDETGTAAVQSALTGNFTALTSPGAALAGISQLDSALVVTSKVTHNLMLHLLGIFNYDSTSSFIKQSKVDYTKDTFEIVLSDETIEVVGNNLQSEKLREVVAKGITLTLPASANTPAAATPIKMFFLDRQASTSPSVMRQFANALQAANASNAASIAAILTQHLNSYGTSSLSLMLDLTPQECRNLFINTGGQAYDRNSFIQAVCAAEATILTGDPDNADRLRLFEAGTAFWQQLQDAGAPPNIIRLLTDQGIRQNSIVDVITILWWSSAMENYAKALVQNKPLDKLGEAVVKTGTMGFNEPWLILSSWLILGKPEIKSIFTSSLLNQAASAAG